MGSRRGESLVPLGSSKLAPYQADFNRVMSRIGSNRPRNRNEPSEEEHKSYRETRYKQMKQELERGKGRRQPFEFEMDEIVLDCYDHDLERGRRSVWRKYRGDVDQLSFRVLKLKKKTCLHRD